MKRWYIMFYLYYPAGIYILLRRARAGRLRPSGAERARIRTDGERGRGRGRGRRSLGPLPPPRGGRRSTDPGVFSERGVLSLPPAAPPPHPPPLGKRGATRRGRRRVWVILTPLLFKFLSARFCPLIIVTLHSFLPYSAYFHS